MWSKLKKCSLNDELRTRVYFCQKPIIKKKKYTSVKNLNNLEL